MSRRRYGVGESVILLKRQTHSEFIEIKNIEEKRLIPAGLENVRLKKRNEFEEITRRRINHIKLGYEESINFILVK